MGQRRTKKQPRKPLSPATTCTETDKPQSPVVSPETSTANRLPVDPRLATGDRQEQTTSTEISLDSITSSASAGEDSESYDSGDVSTKRKRRRRHRITEAVGDLAEEKALEKRIRVAAKEYYLRNFNLLGLREAIEKAAPEAIDDPVRLDFYETDTAKYLTNCKSETHTRMKRYVQLQIMTSTTLEFVDRPDALYRLFDDLFEPEDLCKVFYWVKDVVDYNRSSATGQWFLQNVFLNLAVKTKTHLDLLSKGSGEAPDFKQKMLLSWDRTMNRYSDIRAEDFVRPQVQVRARRANDHRDMEGDLRLFESDIIVTGRPPRE